MRFLILAVLALLAACQKTPQSGEILTYATPYPPGHPFSRADITWIKWVEQQSHGRLRIRPYWSGALLSSDMSMAEIRHGVSDVGLITPIYTRGGAHLLRVQSGFYGGVRTIGDQVRIYDCLQARFPEIGRELDGLVILAVQGGNFPGVLTRGRPIRSLDDFKGLRLRAPTENNDVLKALGTDPVNMPMGEVYSALAKGIIDGVVAPADTIKSLHFNEVAGSFSSIRFSRGAYPARAISDKAFRRLPPDLQNLLLASRRIWEEALETELLKAEAAGIAFGQEKGIRVATMPAVQQARFDALYNRFALAQARDLATLDIDAVPVFEEAQRLVTNPASAARCAAAPY
jgi:TRAP-type C4-dicarboxylate transport system substrate-binding protein